MDADEMILKPCPRCGSDNLKKGWGGPSGRAAMVWCRDCKFTGPGDAGMIPAIEKWNKTDRVIELKTRDEWMEEYGITDRDIIKPHGFKGMARDDKIGRWLFLDALDRCTIEHGGKVHRLLYEHKYTKKTHGE